MFHHKGKNISVFDNDHIRQLLKPQHCEEYYIRSERKLKEQEGIEKLYRPSQIRGYIQLARTY